MTDRVIEAIRLLRTRVERHLELARNMVQREGDDIFLMDMFAIAVLNRSIALLDGFCTLLQAENMIAAAPLLRLQLDNVLRFSAVWLVADPNQLIHKLMSGVPLRNIKDRSGNLMRDSYLIEKLPRNNDWFRRVYTSTSGEIHFSERHFWQAMKADDREDRRVNLKIGHKDAFVTEAVYFDAVQSFDNVTGALFGFVRGWIETKRATHV